MLIGALVARSFNVAVPLVVASTYCFFIGLEGLKRARLRAHADGGSLWQVFPVTSKLFLLTAAFCGAAAVWIGDRWVLVFWALLSLLCVTAYTALLVERRERSTVAEWIGILGITLSAGVAWSAGTGRFEVEAFYLWGICFLYFAGSVPYVRLRVKQMKEGTAPLRTRVHRARDALLYGVVALGLVVLGAWADSYAWVMLLPFTLTLGKLAWVVVRDRPPRSLAAVGYGEIFYASVFTLVAIVAFW